jgi:TonB family protein
VISEDKLAVANCVRVSALLIFAAAVAVVTGACGASVEVSKNAANTTSNTAANAASNPANAATDVKQNAADLQEDDALDARANAAAGGKEIKPVDGFKLKSIEPLEGTVMGGVLNDYATSLPEPELPDAAKAANASGKIPVEVVVNEKGVVSAVSVVEGPQELRAAAAAAARQAKFGPFLKDGKPVKVAGVINYEFAN